MNPFGISQKSWVLLCGLLRELGLIQHAFIFGSRAKGNYQHGSDIDLAIIKQDFTEREAWRLSAKLNEELPSPYHFDVVALAATGNALLKDEILNFGKPLLGS